ncbi:hypothetical protein BD408DRAFT_435821 [Parasitella parasitica]|nr:hypothetical protein BD408DRAFT_435821 [Parasitella parasitica]
MDNMREMASSAISKIFREQAFERAIAMEQEEMKKLDEQINTRKTMIRILEAKIAKLKGYKIPQNNLGISREGYEAYKRYFTENGRQLPNGNLRQAMADLEKLKAKYPGKKWNLQTLYRMDRKDKLEEVVTKENKKKKPLNQEKLLRVMDVLQEYTEELGLEQQQEIMKAHDVDENNDSWTYKVMQSIFLAHNAGYKTRKSNETKTST